MAKAIGPSAPTDSRVLTDVRAPSLLTAGEVAEPESADTTAITD
jgi:hypothetical protein